MSAEKDYNIPGQMSIFDLDIWSGKTYQEPSAQTMVKISEPSLKKQQKWQKGMPAYLDLRAESGHQPDVSWEMGGALPGEYTMHSFGEFPSEERESRLSQILEVTPHPKYCLSAKACAGILRRAEKRGKTLPAMLDAALRRQAGQLASKNEQDAQGGGKGILIQDEHVGALSTFQNQRVLAPGPGIEGEIAGTIDASYYKGCGMREGRERDVVVMTTEMTPKVDESGKSFALRGRDYKDPQCICLNDQGGQQMDVSDGVCGTLRAQEHGHQPIVYGISGFDSNAMKSDNPNSGIYEAQTTRTLDLNGGNPACNQGGMAVVFDASRRHDYEPMGEVCETVQAHYGTGGGNVPIVLEGNGQRDSHRGDGYRESETMYTLNTVEHYAVCQPPMIEMTSTKNTVIEDGISPTLTARMGTGGNQVNAVLGGPAYGLDRASFNQGENAKFNFSVDEEKVGALVARGPSGVFQAVVRRLTPLECERLQGYPDGWTDIGEWVDSKGKTHKDSDAPRYKALGNSIALPFWEWMAARMLRYIPHMPTMASLFDGIGGFPLVFSRNGCFPIWASEIEEFPIAVTKRRFPDG